MAPIVQPGRDAFAGGHLDRATVGRVPPIAPTFTPLDWRQLAGACQTVADLERKRAADTGAKYFERSAETFDRLARRCLEMTRPAD